LDIIFEEKATLEKSADQRKTEMNVIKESISDFVADRLPENEVLLVLSRSEVRKLLKILEYDCRIVNRNTGSTKELIQKIALDLVNVKFHFETARERDFAKEAAKEKAAKKRKKASNGLLARFKRIFTKKSKKGIQK